MAYDFWEDDWESFNTKNWDDTPAQLYDDVMHGEGWHDPFGKMLFDIAFINTDSQPDVVASARDMLIEWLADEYGIDFEQEFDWDTWREWYG